MLLHNLPLAALRSRRIASGTLIEGGYGRGRIFDRAPKRIFDLSVAAICLFLLMPLFALVAFGEVAWNGLLPVPFTGYYPSECSAYVRDHPGPVITFPLATSEPLPLPWDRFASVAIGYTLEAPLLHRVVTAHFDAVLLALEQLHARGYRRVGLALDERLSQRVHRSWLAAFCAFGFETGKINSSAIGVLPNNRPKSAFVRWVRSFRPDAVLSGGPYPVRQWLKEIGLAAPRDIGIACLADLLPDEGCARINEGWHEVGAAAVDGVVGQLSRGERGLPSHPVLSLIRGHWVEGDSVRPPLRPAGY